jgi:ABC-2 type transport system permease protein
VLILLVGAPVYVPHQWQTWLLFPLAVALSSLLFFFLEFMVSSLAFWTSESGGPLFCFELFLQFAAGTFFPLDVLPAGAQKALAFTPFPYMVFFPLNLYLERPLPAGAGWTLLIELGWLTAVIWGARRLWRRGLDSYSAEGG